MARRRADWRRIKCHRSYTVGEAAAAAGKSRLTVRRWIKEDGLPALTEKRPTLIMGQDFIDFLRSRTKQRTKLRLNELLCFRCRAARTPAGNMVDYVARTACSGRLTALCAVCETIMHKPVSATKLVDLRRCLDVSFPQGEPHLNEMAKPLTNDHFRQEPSP